jgi:hypothetical protein
LVYPRVSRWEISTVVETSVVEKDDLRDAETRRRLPCGYEFTTREQVMS